MSITKLAIDLGAHSPSICFYENKYTACIETDDTFYDCESKEVGEFSTRKKAEEFLTKKYGFTTKEIIFFEIED